MFKDVSNNEIVKVLTPHFIVAKHAGGADLECGLQTSTTHDGHNSVHSQLRLGGTARLPSDPLSCLWTLTFLQSKSTVFQRFHSQFPPLLAFVNDFPRIAIIIFPLIFMVAAELGAGNTQEVKRHGGLVNLTTPLTCQRVKMKHFFQVCIAGKK